MYRERNVIVKKFVVELSAEISVLRTPKPNQVV